MAKDVIQFQDEINNRIRYFQNHYVILDSDLAHFFHVETKVLNQAAQRNSKRFPTEFRFQISESDFNSLKSQIVTSKGGNRKLPWAYTEHGIAMMATLLRNDIAIAMSIEIIKAFITMRRIQTNYSSLIARIELLEEFKSESSVILKRLGGLINVFLHETIPFLFNFFERGSSINIELLHSHSCHCLQNYYRLNHPPYHMLFLLMMSKDSS